MTLSTRWATQAPTDVEALNRLRSVPKGFAGSRFGPDLLATVREALAAPEASAPTIEKPRSGPPPQAAGAVVELLKVAAQGPVGEAGVASKLIATNVGSGEDRRRRQGRHTLR